MKKNMTRITKILFLGIIAAFLGGCINIYPQKTTYDSAQSRISKDGAKKK